MKILHNLSLTVKEDDGRIVACYNGKLFCMDKNSVEEKEAKALYDTCRPNADKDYRESCFNNLLGNNELNNFLSLIGCEEFKSAITNGNVAKEEAPEVSLKRGITSLINFFKEFDFEPNFRFINTLSFKVANKNKEAMDYIVNYFSLMDNSYKNEVAEKIKSKEFQNILADIKKGGLPKNRINNRLEVAYGSAGTGKTTEMQKRSENRCIVCNASMLPSDLMEDFVFENGQPSFKPSMLWDCMEKGLPIVLDEGNLLPFDSLRFLQGILDGKAEFNYKGHTVHINDGFKVLLTMNLSIGGMTYGLPEPLVDRCSDIKKYTLDAEMLMKAIL